MCTHVHVNTYTPLPTTAEEQNQGQASFQNQSTWKNGCDSTKPRLNQQWADCRVTVTNDLMWKRRDQMCAEQGPPGACTCQTTGCLGGMWPSELGPGLPAQGAAVARRTWVLLKHSAPGQTPPPPAKGT